MPLPVEVQSFLAMANVGPTTYASVVGGSKRASCSQRGSSARKSALTSKQCLKPALEADTKNLDGQKRKESKALVAVQCNQALEDSSVLASKGEDEAEPGQEGIKQDVERRKALATSSPNLDPKNCPFLTKRTLISRPTEWHETSMLAAAENAAVKDAIKTEIALTQRGSTTSSCGERSAGESERAVSEHSKPPSAADLEDCSDKIQEVDQSENQAEGLALDHEQCDRERHDNGNVHDTDIQEKPAPDGNREENEKQLQDEGRQNELTPNVRRPAPPPVKKGRRKKGKRNKRHSAKEQGMEGRKAGGRGAKVKNTDGKENAAKGRNAKGDCVNEQASQGRGARKEDHQTLAEISNDPDTNKQPVKEPDEKDGNSIESEVESVGGEEDGGGFWEEYFVEYVTCHIL